MPGPAVCMNAMCQCAMGTAPAPLKVTSQQFVMINNMPVATIMDFAPMANVGPFGTCNVLTAAALGVPTPCVPAPTGPWTPGSTMQTINGFPVLNMPAMLTCGIGGVIQVLDPMDTLEITG